MSEKGNVTPEETWALVVAIESYPLRPGLELSGPFRDACDFALWLIARGVPADHIVLLASPLSLEQNKTLSERLEAEGLDRRTGGIVTHESLEVAFNRFHNKPGMLVLFWSGHGIMTTAGRVRRPLLGNYSNDHKHTLNVDSLQKHLRSSGFGYPLEQLLIFDICGTRFDELWHREGLPENTFTTKPDAPRCRQWLLFASEDGQSAENLTQKQTGLYYNELQQILKAQADWPPNVETVHGLLEARFKDLADKGEAFQFPIRLHYKSPSGAGEEADLVAPLERTAAAIADPRAFLEAACVLLRRQMAAIDRECQDRTGKPLEQQFVPVRVARGLRPRLRVDDYEHLERAARQGDYSGRDKQLRDRNEMMRDEETQGRLERPRPVVPWEQARERLRRGAIVGDPGFGKTMLLWHEVRRRCADQLEQVSLRNVGADVVELSVFVRAGELQPVMRKFGGQPLGEALLSGLAARANLPTSTLPWLRDRLRAGGLFLAVDALEEVPTDERDEVLAALKEYAWEYPSAPLLVSSRLVNYTGCPFAVAEEDEVELLAFERGQTDAAVRQWFGDDGTRADEMINHLKTQPAVQAILRSPLLLRLACQSATRFLAAGRPLRLWQRPTELFDDLIDNATELWEQKTPQKPTMIEQSMFSAFASQVAWVLWRKDPARTLFSMSDLGRAVGEARKDYSDLADRKDLIRDLCDAGLIVPVSPDKNRTPFLFTHRTVQEYRAALALAEQPGAVQTALAHIYNVSWQPVLQYLGATLKGSRVWEFVRTLLMRNAEDLLCRPFRLAVLAAMNGDPKELPPSLPNELANRVVNWYLDAPVWISDDAIASMLLACGRRAVPALRSAQHRHPTGAVEGLRRLFAEEEIDPDVLRAVEKDLEDWYEELAGGWYASLPSPSDLDAYRASGALTALIRDLEHGDGWSQLGAVESLGALRAPEAVHALIQALLTDTDELVREESAKALGKLQALEAVPALLQALQNDGDEQVRQESAFALGALQSREALPALLQALFFRPLPPVLDDSELRRKAAIALGQLQDPAAMPALREALFDTSNREVSRECTSSLGRMEKVLPEAVPIEFVKSDIGSDLRLMSSVNDISGMPREGNNLIVVAAVNRALHIRIFDSDGRTVLDTDEKSLAHKAQQIEELKTQLESVWPPHELTGKEKDRLVTTVVSIVGHSSSFESDLKQWNTDLQRAINSLK